MLYYRNVRKSLKDHFIVEWKENILRKTKVRTVSQTLSRSCRSYLAQLRLGVMSLEIEIGRYTSIYDKHTKIRERDTHQEDYIIYATWNYVKMRCTL